MRIIAGKAKGRPLKSPQNMDTRPTTDRVKESLFAILGDIIDSTWLDLYSGTGNIALEAISRGAKEAVLIDYSHQAIRIIQQNIEKTGFMDQCHVYKNTAQKAISLLAGKNKFDYIYLDPPYASAEIDSILEMEEFLDCLSPSALVILEHGKRELNFSKFQLVDQRKYGDIFISFMRCIK